MSTIIIITPKPPPPTGGTVAEPKVYVMSFSKTTRQTIKEKILSAFKKV